MNKSVFVISDVQGCFYTLMKLLKQLPENANIVFVGDLIDRGSYSKEVITFIRNAKYLSVKGNHEQMIVDASKNFKFFKNEQVCKIVENDPMTLSLWLENGGLETLDSYGYSGRAFDDIVFFQHFGFMSNLPHVLEFRNLKNKDGRHLVVTHAPIEDCYNWSLDRQKSQAQSFKDQTLWNREENPSDCNKYIFNVFGHNSMKDGPVIKDHYAAIDNAVYSTKKGYGHLIAFQWPEMIYYKQPLIGKDISARKLTE